MRRSEALALRDSLVGSQATILGRSGFEAIPALPVAVGIVGRRNDYRLAIRYQVETPQIREAVRQIEEEANGEVDVVETGRVFAIQGWQRSEVRPLAIGASSAHRFVALGTLGCFVRRVNGDGTLFLMSNNHVFAQEGFASAKDAILQPASGDSGNVGQHLVARLSEELPLRVRNNVADVAIAEVVAGIAADLTGLQGFPPLAGVRSGRLEKGEPLHKVGRTTFATSGYAGATGLAGIDVEFPTQTRWFDEVIEIEPDPGETFSGSGDSGALVFDSNSEAVGLLFAKSKKGTSYANPIDLVLGSLKLQLALA